MEDEQSLPAAPSETPLSCHSRGLQLQWRDPPEPTRMTAATPYVHRGMNNCSRGRWQHRGEMHNQPHIPWDQGARRGHFHEEAMYNPPAPWQQDINVGDHQVKDYPVHHPFQGCRHGLVAPSEHSHHSRPPSFRNALYRNLEHGSMMGYQGHYPHHKHQHHHNYLHHNGREPSRFDKNPKMSTYDGNVPWRAYAVKLDHMARQYDWIE